jgi:hypothetical protein
MVMKGDLCAGQYRSSRGTFMCVSEQLEGFERIHLKIVRIQTFVSFARVTRNTGVGDPKSGTMTTWETQKVEP